MRTGNFEREMEPARTCLNMSAGPAGDMFNATKQGAAPYGADADWGVLDKGVH